MATPSAKIIIDAAVLKIIMLVTPNVATAASQVILVTAASLKEMLAVSQTTSKTASSPKTVLLSQSQGLGKISLTPMTSIQREKHLQLLPAKI
jgi:hypothetical protein